MHDRSKSSLKRFGKELSVCRETVLVSGLFDALEQHLSTSELTTSVPVVLSCCTLLLT